MAKKKTAKKSGGKKINHRGLWSGSISFGLVNVPVELYSAKDGEQLKFNMLDRRDHARIGYKQINKSTKKEIARSDIVKGYEYEKDQYVIITDEDFKRANVKATQTIEIEDFVQLSEIDVLYFETPYYVVPKKGGEKGYSLLRQVLEKGEKAGVGKIVIHQKQHLGALIVRDNYIVFEILRFADQVLALKKGDVLGHDIAEAKISSREMQIAEQLVESLTSKWDPEKYRDTYHDDILKLINKKIKTGKTTTALTEEDQAVEEDQSSSTSNVVDLSSLLKKSLAKAAGARKTKKQA